MPEATNAAEIKYTFTRKNLVKVFSHWTNTCIQGDADVPIEELSAGEQADIFLEMAKAAGLID